MKHQICHHIETSQLICKASQLTGFYMMATLAFNELMGSNHLFDQKIMQMLFA